MFDYNFIKLLLKYNYSLEYFYEPATTLEYCNRVKVKQPKLPHIHNDDIDHSIFNDGKYDNKFSRYIFVAGTKISIWLCRYFNLEVILLYTGSEYISVSEAL